jgi:protein-tyrosine kinase
MSDDKDMRTGGPLSLFRGGGRSANGNGNGHHSNGNGHSAGRILIPEEYARLHADIERASSPSRCFVVGVTSAVYGEGKTTVAMNLAGTIAQNSTQRVALVDCNLRNWDLQTRLNLPPCAGLVDILEGGEDDLTNIVQKTELDNFTINPAGRAAANPSRMARSPRLAEVMNALRMSNEFIVMDMAPVLPVADTRVLAKMVDGIVMVVRAGVTPREIVARAIDAVGSDRVLGVVLNGTEMAMPKWMQRYFA